MTEQHLILIGIIIVTFVVGHIIDRLQDKYGSLANWWSQKGDVYFLIILTAIILYCIVTGDSSSVDFNIRTGI